MQNKIKKLCSLVMVLTLLTSFLTITTSTNATIDTDTAIDNEFGYVDNDISLYESDVTTSTTSTTFIPENVVTVVTETYDESTATVSPTIFTTDPIETTETTEIVTESTTITTPTTIENVVESSTGVTTESKEETDAPSTIETTTTVVPTTEPSEETSQPTTDISEKTTITLSKSSVSIYVKGTTKINATVKNGNGDTIYSSSDTKVAKVDKNGKVTGIKKGTATITVTNNKVSKTFKVTVKNPKLNITKKTLKLKKTYKYDKSFKLTITGKVGKAKFSSSNAKVATVNQSGKVTAKKTGKTTITVKTNGIKLTCKVTVKALTTLEKLINSGDLKVTYKLKKDSITKNIGTTAQAKNLYTISDNANTLIKQSKAELASPFVIKNKKQLITSKQYEKISETINNVTYSIDDTKIATVSKSGKITPKAKGTTTLKITTFKDTWKVKVTVTKKVNTTFNGKNAICVYSVKETYNYLKDAFYNHIIKGEMPEWCYLMCYYDAKDGSDENSTTTQYKLKQLAYKEIDTGNNFAHYLVADSYQDGMVWMPYTFVSKQTNPYVIEIFWGDDEGENKCEKQMLSYYKKLYTAAQKAFKEMNISECKNDYEKVLAIGNWLQEHTGDTSTYDPEMEGTFEGDILINHYEDTSESQGCCQNWTWTTQYLLTLQNIPCSMVDSKYHIWNLVKYNGKWYHLDIYWNLYFLGNDDITQNDCYAALPNAHKIEVVYKPLTINQIEKKSLVI